MLGPTVMRLRVFERGAGLTLACGSGACAAMVAAVRRGLAKDRCRIFVDGGELPGTPSTVVDLTGSEPSVLREGAVPRAEALARVAAILGE